MKNIFITGANGFLGSQMALRLAQDKNLKVICLIKDKNFRTRRDIEDKVSIVKGDIRDFNAVRYCISHYEIDTIFHLAATTIIKQATIDPITCYESNVMGTVNVLEGARQAGNSRIRKVVVASSDKAYGNQSIMPYVEEMSMMASDPYSSSKACADITARSFSLTYGMDVSVVRAGNIYGPGDLNFSRLIPQAICNILQGKPPVIYKGVGEFRREWMYIDDIINAYLTVNKCGGAGSSYNVGGSGFQNIYDTVNMILKLIGSDLQPEIVDKDFIEIKDQYLDSSKLESLGWKCNYLIEDGLKKTIEWYRWYLQSGKELFYG